MKEWEKNQFPMGNALKKDQRELKNLKQQLERVNYYLTAYLISCHLKVWYSNGRSPLMEIESCEKLLD